MKNLLHHLWKIFWWIFARTAIVYACVFFSFNFLIDPMKLKVHSLNEERPSVEYLFNYINRKADFNYLQLAQYRRYYRKLVKYMPDYAAAEGMLAFLEYHLGNTNKAIKTFEKAQKLEPRFFWFSYDLGLIYFWKGDYKKASEYFYRASQTSAGDSIYVMVSAKAYYALISQLENPKQVLEARFNSAYNHCYVMLVLAYYNLQDFPQMTRFAALGLENSTGNSDFFHYYLALGKYYQKDYVQAALLFRESIKINSNQKEAFHYLSLSLEASGNHEMAVKIARRAQTLPITQSTISLEKEVMVNIF